MYQTISFYDFNDEFIKIRPGSFTHSGLRALFDYLEDMEEVTGEAIELDVIALCGEYSQYDSAEEALRAYNLDDELDLSDHTTVIYCDDDSVIILDW